LVALEFTDDLPSQAVLDRWLGEPIKVIILRSSLFMTGADGAPMLSNPHQRLLEQCFKVFGVPCAFTVEYSITVL